MAHQGYGFCEFLTEEDAEYACKIMNQIKLWGKPIRVNKVRLQVIGAAVFLHTPATQCLDIPRANVVLKITGFFGQKATRCWSELVYWESR